MIDKDGNLIIRSNKPRNVKRRILASLARIEAAFLQMQGDEEDGWLGDRIRFEIFYIESQLKA